MSTRLFQKGVGKVHACESRPIFARFVILGDQLGLVISHFNMRLLKALGALVNIKNLLMKFLPG